MDKNSNNVPTNRYFSGKLPYQTDCLTGTFTLSQAETGKKWYNQLWNEDGYIASVSHLGTGTSRLINTENGKQVGLNDIGYLPEHEERFLYLRDDESHDFWNIGIVPTAIPVDNYKCEHGQLYTRISSEFNGIKGEWMFTVPEEGTYEIWRITIENAGKSQRTLSIFPYIRFDLSGYAQPAYYNPTTTSETVFIEKMNGILCWSKNPYQPKMNCSGFLASSEKVAHYDGWLEKFNGTTGNYARPNILVNGKNCSDSLATVRERGAVLQNTLLLEPGAAKTIYYIAGFTGGPDDAIRDYERAMSTAEDACRNAQDRGIKKFGTLRVNTSNAQIDNVMNFWVQKQVSFCGIGKKAVRDNAQIAMAMLNYNPELAKKIMFECLSHQYSDGHAVLAWSPELDDKLYSDPPMWLILATCEVLKETGDLDFLYSQVPYLDHGTASVYEHLKSAASWLLNSRGPHGLPLIRYADWNDALNIPDENAESVLMGMGTCWAIKELMELADFTGDADYMFELDGQRKNLIDILNTLAWNGDYYIRAFSKYGPVGDKGSAVGGNIYINPQTWAIIGGVVPDKYRDKLYRSIDSMETPYGTPLCMPAYHEYYPPVGRMSGMLPGVFENGGIYNHGCGFKVMAECEAGRREEALRAFIKMCPDGEYNPSGVTTAEPYVFTNCYLMHPAVFNVVGFTWMTGASAWALRGFYEGILGLIRSYKGLQIKPQLAQSLKHIRVRRIYRNCEYEIEYMNAGGENAKIRIDGEMISGDVLPLIGDGKIHKVVVEI